MTPQVTPYEDGGHDQLEAVVRGMVKVFGDRAIEVAKRQLEHAQGEANETWSRIVNALLKASDHPETP